MSERPREIRFLEWRMRLKVNEEKSGIRQPCTNTLDGLSLLVRGRCRLPAEFNPVGNSTCPTLTGSGPDQIALETRLGRRGRSASIARVMWSCRPTCR